MVAPSICEIQYNMAVGMLTWPPTANPNVTAGFTCPPEIPAAMYTADDNANAFASATTSRLDGSDVASGISFPVILSKFKLENIHRLIFYLKSTQKMS